MKLRCLLLFIVSGIFMTGCDFIEDILDSSKNNSIRPEVENVMFSSEGGEKTINVEASCSWSVDYDSNWVSTGGSYGNVGTSELIIYAFRNEDASSRNTVITLRNENTGASVDIYVEQEGAAPTMGELRKQLTVGSDGGEFDLELKSNMRYHARANQEWLYAEPDSYGEFLRVVVYDMPEDFSGTERSANITLYRGDVGDYYGDPQEQQPLRTIKVTQKNVSYRIEFTVAGDYLPFSPDHFDANIIATYCHDGKGYVDFDGPISINDGQFYYEQDLVSIKLPNCVTTIGNEAFCDCDCLESVELPESVTYIGTGAFAGCDNLMEVNFPESLREIGAAAFSRCKKLKSARLNEGLVTISERAFDYCEGLTGVHIPSSVKTVAPQAFAHCYNIDRFSGESTTEDWRCILIDGEIKAFAPASDARFYNVPDEVKSIGSYAFAYLDNIIHVNLGEGVEEIKDHAFYLSSLNNERGGISFKNVKIIGDYAFEETNLVYVSIPDCVTRIGKYAFKGCTMMREFDFGTGVTELEEGVFCWAGIQGFHIPKQITKIGDKAFKDCLIRWVGIPSTTTYIGTEAFQAPNLKTVYVSGKGPASAELGKNIFPEGVRIYVPFDYEALYRRLNNPWLQYDPKDWVPDDVENWDPDGPYGPYLGDY